MDGRGGLRRPDNSLRRHFDDHCKQQIQSKQPAPIRLAGLAGREHLAFHAPEVAGSISFELAGINTVAVDKCSVGQEYWHLIISSDSQYIHSKRCPKHALALTFISSVILFQRPADIMRSLFIL